MALQTFKIHGDNIVECKEFKFYNSGLNINMINKYFASSIR